MLRSADLSRAWGLVDALGWRLPLLLLPNLLALAADSAGWWLCFARLDGRPRFLSLLRVRVSGDALLLALPSGTVVSESLQPYLLAQRCDVSLERGIVATLIRKLLIVLSHGLFLALATLLSWTALDRASHQMIGRSGLAWLLLGVALSLVAAALAGAVASAHRRLAGGLHRGLGRLAGRWLGTWLERNALRFQTTDDTLSSFFAHHPSGLVPPILLYLAAWLAHALETLLFLRVVGVHLPLPTAMLIETALILVRAMSVPVPGGLGVQDVGYVLCLRALGVPDAVTVATAFVVLKRGKDLAWILFGFLLLGLPRTRVGALLGLRPQRPTA